MVGFDVQVTIVVDGAEIPLERFGKGGAVGELVVIALLLVLVHVWPIFCAMSGQM